MPRHTVQPRRNSPAGIHLLVVVVLVVICGLVPLPVHGSSRDERNAERARAILLQVDDLYRAASSHSIITMRVVTRHYTRTLRLEGWSKGKGKSLMRVLAPRKEKDIATLKSGKTIYTFLPKTDRTIRLTSGMMMASWMGSHFTNDDLVKESRLADDYDPIITFEGQRHGQQSIEFVLTPKSDAPVVWGKITILVRSLDHLPLTSSYYDEDMVLVRTLSFRDIREINGRLLPMVMRMAPTDKPTEYTELVYETIDFDVPLDDDFFSILQLRRK